MVTLHLITAYRQGGDAPIRTRHFDRPLDLLSEISIHFICDISEEPEKER